MLIKQMSVFVENTTGRLAQLTRVLGNDGIDIKASCIADTVDFGILRCIVDDRSHPGWWRCPDFPSVHRLIPMRVLWPAPGR